MYDFLQLYISTYTPVCFNQTCQTKKAAAGKALKFPTTQQKSAEKSKESGNTAQKWVSIPTQDRQGKNILDQNVNKKNVKYLSNTILVNICN